MGALRSRLSKLSLKVKILFILVLAGAISIGLYSNAVRSEDRIPRAFANMEIGAVQVINDEGVPTLLWVKIADTIDARRAGFSGVGENIVGETALLYIYPRNTTERQRVTGVRVPLEIGFFQEDGTLIAIERTTVGTSTTYGAPARVNYRYVIMGPEGYFAKHGISVDGEAELLADSLLRVPAWR